jgi:hypothetical protein
MNPISWRTSIIPKLDTLNKSELDQIEHITIGFKQRSVMVYTYFNHTHNHHDATAIAIAPQNLGYLF